MTNLENISILFTYGVTYLCSKFTAYLPDSDNNVFLTLTSTVNLRM